MQLLESKQYSDFVNSINSDQTRRQYEYSNTIPKTLSNRPVFLSWIITKRISDYIINYLVRKISKSIRLSYFRH